MPIHNSRLRKMVKDVNHDAIAAIDRQIDRVAEWKSIGPRERTRVINHLKEGKQPLLEGHDALMAHFLPTK